MVTGLPLSPPSSPSSLLPPPSPAEPWGLSEHREQKCWQCGLAAVPHYCSLHPRAVRSWLLVTRRGEIGTTYFLEHHPTPHPPLSLRSALTPPKKIERKAASHSANWEASAIMASFRKKRKKPNRLMALKPIQEEAQEGERHPQKDSFSGKISD